MAAVSRCMKRLGLSRLKSLEPPVPVVRYERAAAGELLHIDTKKLGRIDGVGHRITGDRTKNHNRGIGWDMVHLAIDDHSRVSFAQVLPDEKAVSCVQFLRQAVAYYASLGVRIERQCLPPRPLLLTPASNPLIESLQSQALRLILGPERTDRLRSRIEHTLPFCHQLGTSNLGGPRLLAFSRHAGMPQLGGVQSGLRRLFCVLGRRPPGSRSIERALRCLDAPAFIVESGLLLADGGQARLEQPRRLGGLLAQCADLLLPEQVGEQGLDLCVAVGAQLALVAAGRILPNWGRGRFLGLLQGVVHVLVRRSTASCSALHQAGQAGWTDHPPAWLSDEERAQGLVSGVRAA